jgi:hypothetical protein
MSDIARPRIAGSALSWISAVPTARNATLAAPRRMRTANAAASPGAAAVPTTMTENTSPVATSWFVVARNEPATARPPTTAPAPMAVNMRPTTVASPSKVLRANNGIVTVHS